MVEPGAVLLAAIPVVLGGAGILINLIFNQANRREDKADEAQEKIVDYLEKMNEMKDARIENLVQQVKELEEKVSHHENRPNRGVKQ